MAWPTVNIDTTHMDSATDNPGNARADIKIMADNVNAIKDAKGAAEGIAPLDAGGKVPTANLPTIPANKGGTGQTSYSVGDLLVATSSTALSKLPPGTIGHVLTSQGPGNLPSYQAGGGSPATQVEMETGTETAIRAMSPLRVAQAIAALAPVSGFQNIEIFNTSGSFTIPEEVTQFYVAVWGAGGGAVKRTTAGSYENGSPGGYAAAYIKNLTPSDVISITIGTGGGTVSTNNGSAPSGGTTSFGSMISATGGQGGNASASPSVTSPGTSTVSIGSGLVLASGTNAGDCVNGFIGQKSFVRPTGAGSSPVAWVPSLNVLPGSAGGSNGSSGPAASAGVNGLVIVFY